MGFPAKWKGDLAPIVRKFCVWRRGGFDGPQTHKDWARASTSGPSKIFFGNRIVFVFFLLIYILKKCCHQI